MEQSERLTLIDVLALAIEAMSGNSSRAMLCAEKINSFAEMIRFLAGKSDSFISTDFEQFSQAREQANRIIEEYK